MFSRMKLWQLKQDCLANLIREEHSVHLGVWEWERMSAR